MMLFGRDAELAEIEARTRTSRLVTIVGPGGVGKTALSRAAAMRVAANFTMGVREVDLTRVDQPAAVAAAMAAQLGFDSFDALLSSPNDRPVLLLVDNCEHLLDASATALVQVLGACQQPYVIATSRSPLELPGESIVSLAPLRLPAAGEDPLDCPAVQLFVERARDAGVAGAADDLESVVELCRRLDGLPLAIEIAAARARTMSVAEISTRMTETIDVLARPRFRGERRHRSIADTIRWSAELLTSDQARLLEQLSVFTGPFTAESIGMLAADDDLSALRDHLDELVNASLVTVDARGSTTRFRLLDTVRRFGLDQLRAREELIATYDRFVDHVVHRVHSISATSRGAWRESALRDLAAGFDDIAEAIRHAVAHDQTPDRAHHLSGALWALAHPNWAGTIVELCRAVLERWPSDGSGSTAGTIATLATAEYVAGQPEQAAKRAGEVLSGHIEPGLASVLLHRALGQSQSALGDLSAALATLRAGAAIGHQVGASPLALMLDVDAAGVAARLGQVENGVAELEGVIERSRLAGSAITECWARTILAWVQVHSRSADAAATLDDALDIARAVDDPIAITIGLRTRAYHALRRNDVPTAAAAAEELLEELIRRGHLTNARMLFDTVAHLAHHLGHPSWERVVATARTLPPTTIVAGEELDQLPTTTASPFPRHDAIAAARHLLAELHTMPGTAPPQSADPTPSTTPPTIAEVGDVWEFGFDGHTVAVRSAKGVLDIVRLIKAGGSEIHCLDLAEAGVEQSSVGDVIDARARRDYEQRIRDLQDDINEAEANGDFERAYRHQVELDALIEHLAAALGHRKHARRTTDTAERARSAVTHRVRTTINRIGKLHPTLARHLTHSINTGIYCSYRPEQPTGWEIRSLTV